VDLGDLPEEAPPQRPSFVHFVSAAPAGPVPDASVHPVPAPEVVDLASLPAEAPEPAVAAVAEPRLPAEPAADDERRADEGDAAEKLVAPRPVPEVTHAGADILVTGTRRHDAVEQYRKLAATLHHVQANRGIRVLLCTSAIMSEGKTVTAANLALTLSHSYQRNVLLVDADLRRPRLHSVFDVPNTDGLYEALGADTDRKVNVVRLSPRLSLVTAGRPGADPVHVLTSERLARVLEDAGTAFDWVIIDTPPVLILPDAGLLMGLVDGAVFVVGAGMTTHRMAKRATEALGRDRIVGVVMNRAADAIIQDSYGGYGGYYGYADPVSSAE
jgi:capsular exopolysaccharide synthesis family protein